MGRRPEGWKEWDGGRGGGVSAGSEETGQAREGRGSLGTQRGEQHGVWVDQWGKACHASPDETGQGFTASLWLTEGQVHRPWVHLSRVGRGSSAGSLFQDVKVGDISEPLLFSRSSGLGGRSLLSALSTVPGTWGLT